MFQDENVLAMKTLCSLLGVSVEQNWEMNSVCVPRKRREEMGTMCKMDLNDEELLVNVDFDIFR